MKGTVSPEIWASQAPGHLDQAYTQGPQVISNFLCLCCSDMIFKVNSQEVKMWLFKVKPMQQRLRKI
jgi:hypothetical protein